MQLPSVVQTRDEGDELESPGSSSTNFHRGVLRNLSTSGQAQRRKAKQAVSGVFSRTMLGNKKRVAGEKDGSTGPVAQRGAGDLFGAEAMRTHRGFEPVCCQAWADAGDGKAEPGGAPDSPSRGSDSSPERRDQRTLSGRLRSQETEQAPAPPGRMAVCCDRFLKANVVQVWMLFLTLAMLYCGDLFQCLLDVGYDRVLSGILWTCLVFFMIEWILNIVSSSMQTPRYSCSLFFFLDFVATISILIDILMMEANNLMENGPIAKAARAARIGTRAGRSVRLLRLMRFLRLIRITRIIRALLKHRDSRAKSRRRATDLENEALSASEKNLTRADTIGAQIGATTTRKVVIMTLLLLIILPLLERNHSFHTCNGELVVMMESVENSAQVQGNCTKLREEVHPWFDGALVPFSRAPDTGLSKKGLIFAQIDRCTLFSDDALMGRANPEQTQLAEQRRGNEIQQIPCDAVFTDSDGDGVDDRSATYFLYDMQLEEKESASYAMGFTTVVIVTLLGFSMIFSQDAEVLANELVVPISQLMEDMSHTSKLELDLVTREEELFESNVYEVKRLQTAYLNLNGAVGSFAKFTPLEVVRHFLSLGTEAKLGVHQRNVSIFFSDIAGFTSICEGTPPVEVLALLSEYFESMVSIIVEEKGTMLEFIGDAILAIWNAPNSVPDHAVRAITSALRMNIVLAQLRLKWREQGKPDIRIRVGLHSADVFVGNLGSKMRMKYGVLGDGVNLASRLEELNKRYQTDILVSEDVLQQPNVRDLFVVRQVDYVVVKGRQKPTAIYEVLSDKETATEEGEQIAEQSEQAMRAYLARDFQQALRCLDQIAQLKDVVRDPAGEVLADRCRLFLAHPPPQDWDGSEVLKEKTFGPEAH